MRGNEKFVNEKNQRPGVCGLCRQSINDEKIADLSSRSAGYVAPHNRFKIRLVAGSHLSEEETPHPSFWMNMASSISEVGINIQNRT